MAFLVQILLPTKAQEVPFLSSQFAQVRSELAEEFGGVTVYSRTTADGLWESDRGVVEHDEVVLFEVMTNCLRRRWWRRYRRELEDRFQQTEVVVRAQIIRRL